MIVARDLDSISWRWTERTLPPPAALDTARRDRRLVLLTMPVAATLFWTPLLLTGPALHPLWALVPALATGAALIAAVRWLRRLVPREIERHLVVDRRGIRLDRYRVRWHGVRGVTVHDGALTVTRSNGPPLVLGHPLRPPHLEAFATPMLALLRARR